jgi:phage baseplate assembly protein W
MTEHLGTGVAFPFGVDDQGRVALVKDETDVDQAIRIILGTAPGERPMRPEFGCVVHELLFEAIDALTLGQVEHAARVALIRWEPRVDVHDVQFDLSQVEDGVLGIRLSYVIRATNSIRNLVHPFYLIPAEEEP